MGLHTGEVEERDGDYFGPAANTGARVCAAGHGGQILFTTAVGELVDTKRVDLGEHRLRDITRPLSLYQVEADGLETEFLPVRSDPVLGSGRRRWMAAAAAGLCIGAVVVAVVLTGGDGGGDRAEVAPTATTKLAPTPELVDTIEVGNSPGAIAEVPDGSIWISNSFDGTFSRVDPTTNEVTDTVNVRSEVAGLEARVGSRLFVVSPEGVIRLINTLHLGVEMVLDLGLNPASPPALLSERARCGSPTPKQATSSASERSAVRSWPGSPLGWHPRAWPSARGRCGSATATRRRWCGSTQ
jgi:hypothetical protein